MLVFILSLLLQVESPITVLNRERVGLSIEINYRYFILKTVDRHVFGAEIDASEKQREEVDEFLKANSAISMAHYKQNLTLEEQIIDHRKELDRVRSFISRTFLPHQQKRIDQLLQQLKLPPHTKNDSFVLVLELSDELDLTPAEKAAVLAKANEMRQKFYEEDAKLLKKARKAIMASLTPSQQQQVVDAIGKPFDFDANSGVKKEE